VASNGRNFLVAWMNGDSIYGRVVGADGVVSADAPAQLTPIPPYGSSMTLLSNGDGYIVLWTLPVGFDAYTIHFRMVDAAGKPGGLTSLPQSERAYSGGAASLAITPAGILVMYDRLADEPEFAGVSRVFARTVVPSTGRRHALSHF